LAPLEDPIEEAKRIIQVAEHRKIALRLFGGVAIYFRSPSATHRSLSRKYVDIDFMGHAKQSKNIRQLFPELGYVPRDYFNATQGYRRLIFNDMEHQRRVDIFLDVFEMCHKFNFKDRLELDSQTLPVSDLLATKLQIVEINEKDIKDILSLFADYEVRTDTGGIDAGYLAKLAGDDWGTYRTFIMNLDRILPAMETFALEEAQKEKIVARMGQLKKAIENAPKSLRWKMRARVGERVRWYELPEADKQIVDSRPPTSK
jgi:hypothetical protein